MLTKLILSAGCIFAISAMVVHYGQGRFGSILDAPKIYFYTSVGIFLTSTVFIITCLFIKIWMR